jgi:hypothetical protein
MIRQFDVRKTRDDKCPDKADDELWYLAGNIDTEAQPAEEVMNQYPISSEMDMGDKAKDDIEGWIDEMMLLSPAEQKQVEEDI